MPHSVAKFLYTSGPESQVFERMDWFGRYNQMRLAERTDRSMVIWGGNLMLWGRTFLKVTTKVQGDAVEVTLEAWTATYYGEWNANPNELLNLIPRRTAWRYAVALAAYLGAAQPEKLFVHPEW